MTTVEWRICAHCGDWIWPAEQVYTDAQGRMPTCAVCQAREKYRLAVRASLSRTDTEETT